MPTPPEPKDLAKRLAEILDAEAGREGPLLPILHAVQAEFGHVPQAALQIIAERLNLTRAEVHGVVSFYHDFRDATAGEHVLKICRSEACQAMGGAGLPEIAKDRLGVDWHQTTPDGKVTLEPVFCLGLCASGPAALVDGAPFARLTRTRFEKLIERLRP